MKRSEAMEKSITGEDIKLYFQTMKKIKFLEERCKILNDKGGIEGLELSCQLSELKRKTEYITLAINQLEKEDRELIAVKYMKKMSNMQLGIINNFSARTMDRKINKIITEIGEWVCLMKN